MIRHPSIIEKLHRSSIFIGPFKLGTRAAFMGGGGGGGGEGHSPPLAGCLLPP